METLHKMEGNLMVRKAKKHFHCIVIIAIFSAFIPLTSLGSKIFPAEQTIEVQAATRGEKNALAKAKAYLKIMAFSKKGLIKQLKFDGFTSKEAKYGAGKCGANWKKQAAKKAKEYLNIMPFSKEGLIKQLKFDGFTDAEAKYGAKKAGF